MIALIAAVAENNVIGRSGDLPWHIPEDLRRFKELTENHVVIMGRKTFESILARIGHPLPNRHSVVISSTLSGALSGVEVYAELQMALSHHASEDVYIIGGQRLYEEGLFFADTMYITHVEQWPDGDAFFPEIDWSKWRKIYEEVHPGFVFAEYRKI